VNDDKVKAYGNKYKANAAETRFKERIPTNESIGLVVQRALTSNTGRYT